MDSQGDDFADEQPQTVDKLFSHPLQRIHAPASKAVEPYYVAIYQKATEAMCAPQQTREGDLEKLMRHGCEALNAAFSKFEENNLKDHSVHDVNEARTENVRESFEDTANVKLYIAFCELMYNLAVVSPETTQVTSCNRADPAAPPPASQATANPGTFCFDAHPFFEFNNRIQSLLDLPGAEWCSGEPWGARSIILKEFAAYCAPRVKIICDAYFESGDKCVRAAGFVHVGDGTFCSPTDGLFVHVWWCASRARSFCWVCQKLWQATFEQRIDVIRCPMVSLHAYRGRLITVMHCVPIVRTDSTRSSSRIPMGSSKHTPALRYLLNTVRAAMGLQYFPASAWEALEEQVGLFMGGDGRCYLLDMDVLAAPILPHPVKKSGGGIVIALAGEPLNSFMSRCKKYADVSCLAREELSLPLHICEFEQAHYADVVRRLTVAPKVEDGGAPDVEQSGSFSVSESETDTPAPQPSSVGKKKVRISIAEPEEPQLQEKVQEALWIDKRQAFASHLLAQLRQYSLVLHDVMEEHVESALGKAEARALGAELWNRITAAKQKATPETLALADSSVKKIMAHVIAEAALEACAATTVHTLAKYFGVNMRYLYLLQLACHETAARNNAHRRSSERITLAENEGEMYSRVSHDATLEAVQTSIVIEMAARTFKAIHRAELAVSLGNVENDTNLLNRLFYSNFMRGHGAWKQQTLPVMKKIFFDSIPLSTIKAFTPASLIRQTVLLKTFAAATAAGDGEEGNSKNLKTLVSKSKLGVIQSLNRVFYLIVPNILSLVMLRGIAMSFTRSLGYEYSSTEKRFVAAAPLHLQTVVFTMPLFEKPSLKKCLEYRGLYPKNSADVFVKDLTMWRGRWEQLRTQFGEEEAALTSLRQQDDTLLADSAANVEARQLMNKRCDLLEEYLSYRISRQWAAILRFLFLGLLNQQDKYIASDEIVLPLLEMVSTVRHRWEPALHLAGQLLDLGIMPKLLAERVVLYMNDHVIRDAVQTCTSVRMKAKKGLRGFDPPTPRLGVFHSNGGDTKRDEASEVDKASRFVPHYEDAVYVFFRLKKCAEILSSGSLMLQALETARRYMYWVEWEPTKTWFSLTCRCCTMLCEQAVPSLELSLMKYIDDVSSHVGESQWHTRKVIVVLRKATSSCILNSNNVDRCIRLVPSAKLSLKLHISEFGEHAPQTGVALAHMIFVLLNSRVAQLTEEQAQTTEAFGRVVSRYGEMSVEQFPELLQSDEFAQALGNTSRVLSDLGEWQPADVVLYHARQFYHKEIAAVPAIKISHETRRLYEESAAKLQAVICKNALKNPVKVSSKLLKQHAWFVTGCAHLRGLFMWGTLPFDELVAREQILRHSIEVPALSTPIHADSRTILDTLLRQDLQAQLRAKYRNLYLAQRQRDEFEKQQMDAIASEAEGRLGVEREERLMGRWLSRFDVDGRIEARNRTWQRENGSSAAVLDKISHAKDIRRQQAEAELAFKTAVTAEHYDKVSKVAPVRDKSEDPAQLNKLELLKSKQQQAKAQRELEAQQEMEARKKREAPTNNSPPKLHSDVEESRNRKNNLLAAKKQQAEQQRKESHEAVAQIESDRHAKRQVSPRRSNPSPSEKSLQVLRLKQDRAREQREQSQATAAQVARDKQAKPLASPIRSSPSRKQEALQNLKQEHAREQREQPARLLLEAQQQLPKKSPVRSTLSPPRVRHSTQNDSKTSAKSEKEQIAAGLASVKEEKLAEQRARKAEFEARHVDHDVRILQQKEDKAMRLVEAQRKRQEEQRLHAEQIRKNREEEALAIQRKKEARRDEAYRQGRAAELSSQSSSSSPEPAMDFEL